MVSIKIFTLPFVIFKSYQIYCRLKIYNIYCVSLLILSLGCGTKNSSPPKYIKVSHAGVASADVLASQVGVDILQKGGNAADAATAVAMSLAVVIPQVGNLGGGGFILYRSNSGEVFSLDFRETAPTAATVDMYLNKDGILNSEKSQVGATAVGVPGTVRGFYQFHNKYGNLNWSTVLSPAVQLAGEGFILSEFQSHVLNQYKRHFEKFASSSAIFLPEDESWQAGDKFVQKDLSKSLQLIAKFGDSAFYEGEIAAEIVRAVNENGGLLSLEDFKNYRAVPRKPIVINYYDYVIYAMPPPSSGGVVLAGILQCLQKIGIEKYSLHSSQQIALLSELEKHYFALRNEFLSDPDFVDIPIPWLLSPALSNEVLAQVSIGSPTKSDKIVKHYRKNSESKETTHFSVLDASGNAVSVSYTLNGYFGCKLVAGKTGILLNNEMDDFSAKPGVANMFGLVQGETNAIAPGKRMLSSMCPIIVTRDNQLVGLFGSPGGPQIITSVLQVLINLINYGLPLNEAIAAGRFHHQCLPDSIYIESEKFDVNVLKELEVWGYGLIKQKIMGNVQAIWNDGSQWDLCSDNRSNGYPVGY